MDPGCIVAALSEAKCGSGGPGLRCAPSGLQDYRTRQTMDDDDDDRREEIVRLEADIEQFAQTIESCRKLILISKGAMAVAALLILAALLGAITIDPAVLIGAFGVFLGAIVVFGSNSSTLEQAMAATKAAELRRSELIGQIDLQLVRGYNGRG
jgi:hypothetical protein